MDQSFWMPPQNSTFAADTDALFMFIYYVSIVFFVLVMGVSFYFVQIYRRTGKPTFTTSFSHNVPLEFTWTIIPTVLVFVVFFWGFTGYINMNVPPKDALEIKVTAQKWFWVFDYPNGSSSTDTLVIPEGRPVKLTMSSGDVLHSFYVPDFRIKMDVIPNRYTLTWFEANTEGISRFFCTEYCGAGAPDTTAAGINNDKNATSSDQIKQKGHFNMQGIVRIVSSRQYEAWLESSMKVGEGMSLESYGEVLYNSKQCVTCHSVNGGAGTGPTWKGLYGNARQFADGTSAKAADDNYLRQSILEPQAKIVAGYQGVMPTYQGLLKDKQIDAIIAYIKSIK